jgi:uncharacterized protein with NRDE domain
MCLIALAWAQHPRYPLVVAANRDEFLQRPSAVLDWWLPSPGAAPVLGGRDLQAGGTWMGLSANGRLALLTNVRDPAQIKPLAPSRGVIVPAWLNTPQSAESFCAALATAGHNPFNLLAVDWAGNECWYAGAPTPSPLPLSPGLYGLSNAALDTPWPKVQRLKLALAQALAEITSTLTLEAALFSALADRSPVADSALPDTGVGIERERGLAPAFIHAPAAGYGTRCSTLLIVERSAQGLGVQMIERQFDAAGRACLQRRARLAGWPLAASPIGMIETTPLS